MLQLVLVLGGAETTSVSLNALPSASGTSFSIGSGGNLGGEVCDVVSSTELDACDFAGKASDVAGGEAADNAGGESGGKLAGTSFSCNAHTGSGTATESSLSCCSVPDDLSNSIAVSITDTFFIGEIRFKRTSSLLLRIVFSSPCVAFK